MSFSRIRPLAVFLVFLPVVSSCIQQRRPTPPAAQIEPYFTTIHGVTLEDNYHWLRERGNPAVMRYLEAENEYTAQMMKHTEDLQRKLYNEFLARLKETDQTIPEKDGNYWYYERTEEGRQYPILCRKKDSKDAREEIMLDENRLAEGHAYFDVGTWEVTPNGRILAYSVDTVGAEAFTIYFKDLQTGLVLPDEIPNTFYSLEWGNDSKTLFYTTLDEIVRPYRLYRHRLGTDYRDDDIIYEEKDLAYEMYLSKTKSDEYVLMKLESNTTTEIWYLDADKPEGDFQLISPRKSRVEYMVYHLDDRFLIRTNENAPNFKVLTAPVKDPQEKNWKEFIGHNDSVMIADLDAFANFLVLYERKDGLKQMRVLELKSGESHFIELPETVYTLRKHENKVYNSNVVRFTYTSLISPKAVYDYDMAGRSLEVKKEYEVLGGYDKTQYTTERLFAPAPDGAMVPISIVYKKGARKGTPNPLLLYGYGAYGLTSEPNFEMELISLLDRGVIYAIAHVRGGSEMGRYWYEEGRLFDKRNTFSDFIACAEYLVEQGLTSPDKLAAEGVSAGGLLIGAVANMRPDLFKAMVGAVPFVDVINTMLDPSIPLTVIEYEEWGNPNEEDYFDYMMTYSPYDNVKAQEYPNMLVTAGLNDARVQYWEPAKWTAKLRAVKTDNNRLLLRTNMGAGHFGESGRYDRYRRTAFEYAFLLDAWGIKN
ncbi:MAG: S9 family peptidase [Candidatus Zixiibacteriota bacterium]